MRTPVLRVLDGLDALTLSVLEALVLAGQSDVEGLQNLLAPLEPNEIATTLDRLAQYGLVWGGDAAWRPVTTVIEAVGPYPSGLGRSSADFRAYGVDLPDWTPASAADAIDALPPTQRTVVDRLADGPPLGTTADGTGPQSPAVDALIDGGLLVRLDPTTVELPREIGLAARGRHPMRALTLAPPPVEVDESVADAVDATAATAVLETLRHLDDLGRDWSTDPPAQLRSGGLGVRELKRTARVLDLSEGRTALLAEIAVAADLIGAPTAREIPWRPTTDFDLWAARDPAERWVRIAAAWLGMTRQPSLVGSRDERGKPRAALSFEVDRSAAVTVRHDVVELLAGLPTGTVRGGPEAVLARLGWMRPRRIDAIGPAAAAVLSEAEFLGVTGGGGLTRFGRALLDGDQAAAVQSLSAALPEPVEEFLVQPDLSLVVPGPPTMDLARELTLVADLESGGGASVYRVSEASVRRALDAGRTAADVQALFAARSRTPVPQALTYLVDDLARRHGTLRVGTAESYLRCADPAQLDRVLSDRSVGVLRLRRLAPTVALTDAEPEELLAVLREAGYVPAAEDASGAVVAGERAPERARPRRSAAARQAAAELVSDSQLDEVVRRVRTGDELARTAHPVGVSQSVPGVTSARTFEVLRGAIRADRRVWISHVDAAGRSATSIISPLSLGGGFLRGNDTEGGQFRSIPLHRITSVNVLSDDSG